MATSSQTDEAMLEEIYNATDSATLSETYDATATEVQARVVEDINPGMLGESE